MLFSGFPQTIWHWSKISSCHYRNHFVLTCHRVLSSFHRPWYLSLSHPQRKRNAPPATKGRSYCISNFRRTRNETQHQTRIEMPLYSSPVPSHLLQSLLQHRDIYQISMSLLMRVMSHRTHNMYDELPLHYLIMSTLKPNRLSDYRTAGTGDITWIMGSSLAGTYLDHGVFTVRRERKTTQHAVELAYLWDIQTVEIVKDSLTITPSLYYTCYAFCYLLTTSSHS